MAYKKLVQNIKDLPWYLYDPKSIIFLSWCAALEFAESLRCALEAHPENESIHQMALGELSTRNLSYDDYNSVGDHHQFLEYFIRKNEEEYKDISVKILTGASNYVSNIRRNFKENKDRAMTIFSREQELPDIFEKILKSHNWDKLGLGWFRYYLERHIELDSSDGGHAELTKDFELDEKVLEMFYTIRLNLYKALKN